MTSEQLTKIHTARPFEPFRIHLADGRQFDVEHPEFLAYRGGRIATVFSTPEYAEFVDLLLVTSVELTGGTSKRRKKQ